MKKPNKRMFVGRFSTALQTIRKCGGGAGSPLES